MESKENSEIAINKEKPIFEQILGASARSGFITGIVIIVFTLALYCIGLLVIFILNLKEINFNTIDITSAISGLIGFVFLGTIIVGIYWLILSFFLIVFPSIVLGSMFHYFQKGIEYKIRKKRILIIGIICGSLVSLIILIIPFIYTGLELTYLFDLEFLSSAPLILVCPFAGYYNNLLFFNHLYGKNPEIMKAQE